MPVLDGDFEAFVTNLGKYNEGMLVGEWVKLPTTEEEMQKVFERIGIGKQDEFGQPYEEWFITDYGYAWAGVLPAGQEAAEKALEKGCEVYRLYSDNTEGLCVDAKEIADHAAKGGMLGISKESWMAALEKENYLKAAEMSMEDDYGMIDGIINNGPKEDKTAAVKAPETGEKSSIMERLKSAKAEKQKECCPPQKHKGEIEL